MKENFIPYTLHRLSADEILLKTKDYKSNLTNRRSVRNYSEEQVPKNVIEEIIMAASLAPSGANKQPWTFCAISSPSVKRKIRLAAEKEEYKSYTERMSDEWKDDLKKLKTNWQKPFLEEAPWLIAVFMQSYELVEGKKRLNYYVKESVGLATGFLLTAIYNAGLASLTYTPSPMRFLQEILKRPVNEKPYMLIPVGYPAENAMVPLIQKKKSERVISYYT